MKELFTVDNANNKRKTKISFDLAAQIGRGEKLLKKSEIFCTNSGTKTDRNDKVIFCFCVAISGKIYLFNEYIHIHMTFFMKNAL